MDKADIMNLLPEWAEPREIKDNIITVNCPLCGDSKHRGWINIERQKYYCFRASCVSNVGIKLREAFSMLNSAVPYLPSTTNNKRSKRSNNITLPTDIIKFSENLIGDELHDYYLEFCVRKWRVSIDTIFSFSMGYSHSAKRIVIPVIMNDDLVGYTLRSVNESKCKYLHFSTSEHSASTWLFGYDKVGHGQSRLFIVEGVGDVLGLYDSGEKAVAVFGCFIKGSQIQSIVKLEPGEIIIAFHNDAERSARSSRRIMLEYHPNVRIGMWVGGKDYGEGGRIEVV